MPTWPAETREQALSLLRDGVGTRETERRTGVPKQTLSRWAKTAGINADLAARTEAAAASTKLAWAQRRALLVDELGNATVQLLEKTLAAEDGRDARGWATALAILVDKAQLLSGAATSRHEVFDRERRLARISEVADELAARRDAKSA